MVHHSPLKIYPLKTKGISRPGQNLLCNASPSGVHVAGGDSLETFTLTGLTIMTILVKLR